MHEQMTVLRPAAHSPEGHGISAFPPEVLEQVRGRVRLLSGLLLLAFAFDLVVYAGNWMVSVASRRHIAMFRIEQSVFRTDRRGWDGRPSNEAQHAGDVQRIPETSAVVCPQSNSASRRRSGTVVRNAGEVP
jgi:hypothetical protein